MQEWLAGLVDAVPDFTAFPLVDELVDQLEELASRYPDVASLIRAGTSRLGEPITALRVESGPREALVFGGVHPNEPIGGLTALHLARALCAAPELRQRLSYSWTVVPCIDPDGMRLNEGWFKGPFVRSHYGRHFYRPAGEEQVEWTFPFRYKKAYFDAVLPETLALMRQIDERKPALMCSLHNGELGGAYYYLSTAVPGIYQELQEIPALFGLPLDLGEPEVPYVERFADAIYGMIRSEDAYDFAEASGTDPLASRSGASERVVRRPPRYGYLGERAALLGRPPSQPDRASSPQLRCAAEGEGGQVASHGRALEAGPSGRGARPGDGVAILAGQPGVHHFHRQPARPGRVPGRPTRERAARHHGGRACPGRHRALLSPPLRRDHATGTGRRAGGGQRHPGHPPGTHETR